MYTLTFQFLFLLVTLIYIMHLFRKYLSILLLRQADESFRDDRMNWELSQNRKLYVLSYYTCGTRRTQY